MKIIDKIPGIFTSLLLVSCAVILDPDLTDQEVILRAPADNTETSVQTHTFWWDYVTDAEKYNLIIVSPNFDTTLQLVEDTNLTNNSFIGTLAPGQYEWGVSAYNNSSATPYSIFRLYIDTLSGLSNQYVQLLSPPDNSYTSETDITFKWQTLTGATSYILEVRDSTWLMGQTLFSTPRLTENTYSASLSEGIYSWGVIAYDEASNTNSNLSTGTFGIDITAPGKPTITLPAYNGDTLDTSPYTIEWTHPAVSLAPITDSVMVSTDSLFAIGSEIEVDVLSTQQYSVSSLDDGKYYVKVKSFDAAGNQGEYCLTRKFYLYKTK